MGCSKLNITDYFRFIDDGIMTQCSLGVPPESWSFTYNAENRIIVAENAYKHLEFTYDYMGRRVSKKIYNKSGSTLTFVKELYFIYDGYKQIMRLRRKGTNPTPKITRKYIWMGTGAASPLVAVYQGKNMTPYYAFADANKNITEYVDANGNIAAHFEYSPFGKITKTTGSIANRFVFRFSLVERGRTR